jgi:hypothetical protein
MSDIGPGVVVCSYPGPTGIALAEAKPPTADWLQQHPGFKLDKPLSDYPWWRVKLLGGDMVLLPDADPIYSQGALSCAHYCQLMAEVSTADRIRLAGLFPEHARFAARSLVNRLKQVLGSAAQVEPLLEQLIDQLPADAGLPAGLVEALRSGAAVGDPDGKHLAVLEKWADEYGLTIRPGAAVSGDFGSGIALTEEPPPAAEQNPRYKLERPPGAYRWWRVKLARWDTALVPDADGVKLEGAATYECYREVIDGNDVTAEDRALLARLYPAYQRRAAGYLVTALLNIFCSAADAAHDGRGPRPEIPRWQHEIERLLQQLAAQLQLLDGSPVLPAELVEVLRSGEALDDRYGRQLDALKQWAAENRLG